MPDEESNVTVTTLPELSDMGQFLMMMNFIEQWKEEARKQADEQEIWKKQRPES